MAERTLNSKHDEQLLSDFATRFLGYGTLDSKTWLIGPEPGGGPTIEDVYARALVWSERGRAETEDLHSYHDDLKCKLRELSLSANFDWRRNIQPTWGPLIRIILSLDHSRTELDTAGVREFQANELGRANGRNCVIDLMPFSSPSQTEWRLAHFGFTWLSSRREYKARLVSSRCDLVRAKLVRYRPHLVLFYGDRLEQQEWWSTISQQQFVRSKRVDRLLLAHDARTIFGIIPHPVNINTRLPDSGPGAVKRFLAQVAAALREELQRL
jgi:hypothetical protein